jgi:hypothetical protein
MGYLESKDDKELEEIKRKKLEKVFQELKKKEVKK